MQRSLALVLLVVIAAADAAAQSNRDSVAAAQRLAWEKQFDAAEREYRRVLSSEPDSIDARVGLADVLRWQLRLAESVTEYRAVLARLPNHLPALTGLATASWWSGDWRTARRNAVRALTLDRDNEEMQLIVRSIDEVTATTVEGAATLIDDDQPYTILRAESVGTHFSDPLTRWRLRLGTYRLDGGRTTDAPFAGIEGTSFFTGPGLDLGGSFGMIRQPDDGTLILPSVVVAKRLGTDSLSLSWEREPLLRTRGLIDDFPHADVVALRFTRAGDGWTGAAGGRILEYDDGNRGSAADVWLLSPYFAAGPLHVALGSAASYRDTEESRFDPIRMQYDRYWTPESLVELRGVIDLKVESGAVLFSAHLDGGVARETIEPLGIDREFRPWSARLSTDYRFAGWTFGGSIGVDQTSFYRATTLHGSVARRF